MKLTLSHIDKTYKQKKALDGITFELNPGVYGLLGNNGAGKSTLMRIICNILTPTKGSVLLDDENIQTLGVDYRNILGYLPQDFGYYPDFSALMFMEYIAALKGLPNKIAKEKSLQLLDEVGLGEVKKLKIKQYSGGMKQRLGIAQVLLNDPKLILLDEPTAGLDPKERVRFRNLISQLSSERIVLLSTHIVSDIEFIADKVLILKEGKLIRNAPVNDLLAEITDAVWETDVAEEQLPLLEEKLLITNMRHDDKGVLLRIVSSGKPLANAHHVAPNLEDLYLYHFKQEVSQ